MESREKPSDPQVGAARTLNIADVAAAAGVSKTTVSHVLSGKRPVSDATRRTVERVVKELGYRPNFFAQALNSKRSHTIALLAQDITNPFYPAVARGVQKSVASSGQAVMLFDAGAGRSLTRSFIDDVIQRQIDGVVVAVSDIGDGLAALVDAGVAVVAVGSRVAQPSMDWVSADDSLIGADAVRYLHQAGHRRIAIINGPLGSEPGASRSAGYHVAVEELGLAAAPFLRERGDWTRESGAAALRRLLAVEEPPTAVVCANDLMAIGALGAAHEAGLAIPRDLAIIGVDDIDAAALVSPALTTVRIPAEEIGRSAGDLLQQRINKGLGGPARHVLVQHTLIRRQSA